MRVVCFVLFSICISFGPADGQSGRYANYSESGPKSARTIPTEIAKTDPARSRKDDTDVIRVESDLVTIPVRITGGGGRPITDIRQNEFKVFENGVEQEIALFSSEDQPFTVALVLDMSYSSVFRLEDIQRAAFTFVKQLKPDDRIMVVSFDGKPHILCEATADRRVLQLAIEGAKIGSGTAVYDTFGLLLNEKLGAFGGRKAVVLLSDGVDTSSRLITPPEIIKELEARDVIVYPLRYDTYDDVQKSRRNDAQVQYDDNDRPYIVEQPQKKGERPVDYEEAREFLNLMAGTTGGRVYRVGTTTNLDKAFADIANELRKIYSLGYYPYDDRMPGRSYEIRVRVYRPGLTITTRDRYVGQSKQK
ncbi:MAG: VWA domain-containing protein [Acidobacteriota bacterium]